MKVTNTRTELANNMVGRQRPIGRGEIPYTFILQVVMVVLVVSSDPDPLGVGR